MKCRKICAFLLCLALMGAYITDGSLGETTDRWMKTVVAEQNDAGVGSEDTSSRTSQEVSSKTELSETTDTTTESTIDTTTESTIDTTTESTIELTTSVTTQDVGVANRVELSATALNIKENVKRTLTAKIYPETTWNQNLVWTSSNEKIAKVSSSGVVTALKKGVTTIVATLEDGSAYGECKVQVEDNFVIVLDPGHGNHDSGAVNRSKGLVEQKINMDIAKACRSYLEKYENVTVFMTRSSYTGFLGLTNRAKYAQAAGADVFISMHINASGYRGTKGCSVYVTRYTGANKYNKEMKALGKKIISQLKSLGIRSQGVLTRRSSCHRYSNGQWADYYSVIRNSTYRSIPALLIEHAYIDSSDYKFMNTAAKRKKLGQADAKAIVAYYGLQLKSQYRDETAKGENTTAEATTQTGVSVGDTTQTEAQSTTQATATTQQSAIAQESMEAVVESVTGIKLNVNATSLSLKKGKTYQLKATIAPSVASNKSVIYSTSNKKIATVTAKGKIKAVKKGSCTITCEALDGSGVYKTLKVTVKK